MSANDTQVGGNHYKTTYQHWDLAIWVPMGYLEGCSTKYITRWRKKNGVQDLRKALHYLDKLIESYNIYDVPVRAKPGNVQAELTKFAEANMLTEMEAQYIYILCTYVDKEDLFIARKLLLSMVELIPGTPDDGGHHGNM